MKNSGTSARRAVSGSTDFPWDWRLEDLDKRPKHGHTVFSCFSCGGGSSMGYKLAGYEVVGNCEIDPDMMKIYRRNNHPEHSFLMDIRDFVELPDGKIPEKLKCLDVLDGSPPCSVFSMAGVREDGWNVEKAFREGQAKQRLDDLFLYFIQVAERLKPKVVIAENVKGLITGNAKGWVNQIVGRLMPRDIPCRYFCSMPRAWVSRRKGSVYFSSPTGRIWIIRSCRWHSVQSLSRLQMSGSLMGKRRPRTAWLQGS